MNNVTDLPSKTLEILNKKYAIWEKLNAEVKSLNKAKGSLLDSVDALGVDRVAFKTWAKRRKWDTDRQKTFDFSLEQCRKASPVDEPIQDAA